MTQELKKELQQSKRLVKQKEREIQLINKGIAKLNFLTEEDRILEVPYNNNERIVTEDRLNELGISGWDIPFEGRVAFNKYMLVSLGFEKWLIVKYKIVD